MPVVTATATIPDQKLRLLIEAYETYKAQKGLDSSFTIQMFADEIFVESLKGQWRMADSQEVADFKEQFEAADDATRAQVNSVLNQ